MSVVPHKVAGERDRWQHDLSGKTNGIIRALGSYHSNAVK